MSGLFSLGGKDQGLQQKDSLLAFKNEEIYNKGFELWQQYHHPHQHRIQQQNLHHNSQDVDFSVGPSGSNIRRNSSNIVISGDIRDDSSSYSNRSASRFRVTRLGKGANAGMNCQDCGNQAKKDCSHLRCRTCCKSRGFSCQTHLKSTWVSAAQRRERQHQLAELQQDRQLLTVRGENPKRFRENPVGGNGGGSFGGGSTLACATTTRFPASTSGFEFGHFPPEVNSPAVFRCVRVSAMDDAEEHCAYQTSVNIGGHVFKGILYDQGLEIRYPRGGGDQAGSSGQQPLHLMAEATTASHPNATMLDPSIIYPTPMNAFMAGTQFFSPPRP